MAIDQKVNPPPIPRIPSQFSKDKSIRAFFQEIQTILLQLYIKTGAGGSLLSDTLASISELGTAANKGIYTTAVSTFAEFDLTAFARSILDDADEAAFKATVNLEIGTDVQAYDATLQSLSALGTAADKVAYTTDVDTWAEADLTAFARSILDDADEATFKATVNLEIGTDVQAYDATLQSISALGTASDRIAYTTGVDAWAETPLTAFARSILDDADEATFKATVNLKIGTDVQAYSANLDEAGTFFGSTDISGAEAETLTDASNADSLHVHSTVGLSDVTSGTYTPTITSVANVDATTAYACQYLRVGSTVTVSGQVDIDPTTGATPTQIGVSLPLASNFSATEQCGGTAATIDGDIAAIYADATNDRAQFEFVATGTGNKTSYFSFTYQVI